MGCTMAVKRPKWVDHRTMALGPVSVSIFVVDDPNKKRRLFKIQVYVGGSEKWKATVGQPLDKDGNPIDVDDIIKALQQDDDDD